MMLCKLLGLVLLLISSVSSTSLALNEGLPDLPKTYTNTLLLNFLKSEASPPLDAGSANEDADKLFLHILGDSFGKGSRLEGNSSQNTLAFRLKQIRSMIESVPGVCEKKTKTELLGTCAISDPPEGVGDKEWDCYYLRELEFLTNQALDLTIALNTSAAIFHERFHQALEGLTDEHPRFFFSAGWSGHAVVLEVSKELGGFYRFRIYNTGGGVQYHALTLTSMGMLVIPFDDLHGVSRNTLQSETLSAALYKWKMVSDPPIGEKEFYNNIREL